MAIYADRVKETTTTTGTGTYSLSGASVGYRTFVAGVGTGQLVTYAVDNGTDWEVGEGTITDGTPDTLSRTTIIASSNGGAAVDWAAGDKTVFLTLSAARLVTTDKDSTITGSLTITSQHIGNGSDTASAPSYSWAGDLTTGMWRTGASSIGLSTGGTNRLTLSTTELTSTLPIVLPLGSATAPSLTFTGDTNTGIYSSGADALDFASAGSRSFSVQGVTTAVNFVTAYSTNTGSNPELSSFASSDTNIGLSLLSKGTTTASDIRFAAYDGTNYRHMFRVQPSATITGTQNYVTAYSTNTGGRPYLSAGGVDANAQIGLFSNGTGSVRIGNGGGSNPFVRIFSSTTNGANRGFYALDAYEGYTEFIQANYNNFATANSAYYITTGTSTNSIHQFQAYNGTTYYELFGAGPGATITSAQNYVYIRSGNTGVAPTIEAEGGDTNINLDLLGKGTGSIRFNGTATTISSTGALTTSQLITGTAGATFSGAIVSSTRGFASAEYSAGSGAPGTIDWNNGQNQVRTLTSSGTITLSNPVNGATYKLRIVQGGTGSYTITWPTIKWAGGAQPTLSSAVGAEDIVTLYYNGTSYYGQAATGFA